MCASARNFCRSKLARAVAYTCLGRSASRWQACVGCRPAGTATTQALLYQSLLSRRKLKYFNPQVATYNVYGKSMQAVPQGTNARFFLWGEGVCCMSAPSKFTRHVDVAYQCIRRTIVAHARIASLLSVFGSGLCGPWHHQVPGRCLEGRRLTDRGHAK
jgi:hypothetical protein